MKLPYKKNYKMYQNTFWLYLYVFERSPVRREASPPYYLFLFHLYLLFLFQSQEQLHWRCSTLRLPTTTQQHKTQKSAACEVRTQKINTACAYKFARENTLFGYINPSKQPFGDKPKVSLPWLSPSDVSPAARSLATNGSRTWDYCRPNTPKGTC